METQDIPPTFPMKLEKVGIKNLRTLIKIVRGEKEFRHIPIITIFMDLDEMKKGVHMSRFIESITETVEEEVVQEHTSLEQIGKDILQTLKDKHHFLKAGIEFTSELPIHEKTPSSGRDTTEIHDIFVQVSNTGDTWRKTLRVSVTGNTACPHALSVNEGKTHIQRATGVLEVETDFENDISLEEMVEVVEESFSSKVYTLAKTEDESLIVKRMYENPLFVEDVCRNMLALSSNWFSGCTIHARCVSHESIHRHDVYAEGSVST